MTIPMGPRLTAMRPGREYRYQPIVTVRLTDTGTVAIDIDWADSTYDVWDNHLEAPVTDDAGERDAGEHLDRLLAAGALPSGTGCAEALPAATGCVPAAIFADPLDFWTFAPVPDKAPGPIPAGGWPHPYRRESDHEDVPADLDGRYVLVEESPGDGSRYVTAHDTLPDAAAYHAHEGDGWRIVCAHDQGTGDRFQPVPGEHGLRWTRG